MTARVVFFALAALAVAAAVAAQGRQEATGPVYVTGSGVTPPVLTKSVEPSYSADAVGAGIQGEVWIRGIVETDGAFTVIAVTKSLDPGLDWRATEAARRWQFRPGVRANQPVRVSVQLIMEFKLANKPSSSVSSVRVGFRADSAPEQLQLSPEQLQLSDEEFARGAYKTGEPGLVPPKVKSRRDPYYTSAAMHAKIQGSVTVEAVVLPDGTVERARVVESLDKDNGLDASALEAAKKWTFVPGKLGGMPVPVLITLVMEFRLH